ncbi:MAG: MBL fold metallo-hydrolase [Planctomycetota bacterium]|jgi:phosphoribosyl 1,2-cyclic phosphodiesterase|nr:MBL fold metallo-hydrolase [Blastopirellula sp.]
MEVISLQSGSNGNCYFVQSGNVSLVIDAGISGSAAENRLREKGKNIRSAQGLLITHDHRDHTQSMGIYQRKFGLPIYITEPTFRAVHRWCKLGRLADIRHFNSGDSLQFEQVSVHSIPTPHDGADGVAYVIEDGQHRLGILTDLGHAFAGLREVLQSLDAVIIESNYDEQMLEHGPYPQHLKQRIRGPGGHLSNREAAELIRPATNRLQWACLCHLSQENNHPRVALDTHRELLGSNFPLHISGRYQATDVLRLE